MYKRISMTKTNTPIFRRMLIKKMGVWAGYYLFIIRTTCPFPRPVFQIKMKVAQVVVLSRKEMELQLQHSVRAQLLPPLA